MTRSMRALFFIFLGHAALTVYAAFALSLQAWGFISGGLFYILFAAFFISEWLRNRAQARRTAAAMAQYADEEWFDLVDADGRVIGKAPRSLCHAQKGLLHPVVHLHVLDGRDRLFLQKRSPAKQIQPGKWDTAVGGHVRSGEGIEAALKRETVEETGLEGLKTVALARYVWESDVESELVHMFIARSNRPPRIDPSESTEGKFWKIAKVREALGKGMLTPNLEFEFDILLKQVFGEKDSKT
jgi:isopentenyldiphosphate isomerase